MVLNNVELNNNQKSYDPIIGEMIQGSTFVGLNRVILSFTYSLLLNY